MIHLKRIEIKKRPQHFQQGGNIAIGSPKPYTTTLPGVNFNPLTLNNAPIEINTTGISDQINKMRQLAFDREALAFKYKELEYKEGKEYLDFYGKILGDLGGTSEKIKSIGGVASLSPIYKPIIDEYNAEMNKLSEDTLRAIEKKDFKTATQLTMKRGTLAKDPKYNSTLVIAGAYDKLFEGVGKGEYGPFGMDLFQRAYDNILGAAKEDPLQLFAEAAAFKASGMTTDGLNKSLSKYDELFKPQEIEVSAGVDAAGRSIKTTEFVQRDPEFIARAMAADSKTDPNLRGLLHVNNIGNDNEEAKFNFFLYLAKARMKAFEPPVKKKTDTSGGVITNIVRNADGSVNKVDADGNSGKGPSEGDKDYDRIMRAVRSTYGDAAANDPKIQAIAGGTGSFSDLWALIEADVKKAGYSTNTAGGGAGRTGIVPGTESLRVPLPNTLEGIKKVVNYIPDPKITREKVVDGNRYLITSDNKLIEKLEDYPLEPTTYGDVELREKFGFKDVPVNVRTEKEDEWNALPWQKDAHVYNLGPATEASTTSAGFDPTKLGEPVAATVAALNLPRKDDFNGEINSHLGEMSRDVLNKYQMRITDTSDSAHDSLAQSTYGTSFDVNFDPSKVKPSETIMNIDKALADFRANGLKAVYEVKTQSEKDAILKANKNLKDSDVLVWPKVSGPHFSVTCENCARLDAIKGQTPTNEVKKPTKSKSGAIKPISILDI